MWSINISNWLLFLRIEAIFFKYRFASIWLFLSTSILISLRYGLELSPNDSNKKLVMSSLEKCSVEDKISEKFSSFILFFIIVEKVTRVLYVRPSVHYGK